MDDKTIDQIIDNGDRLHGRNGYPTTGTTKAHDMSRTLEARHDPLENFAHEMATRCNGLTSDSILLSVAAEVDFKRPQ